MREPPFYRFPLYLERCGWVGPALADAPPIVRTFDGEFDGAMISGCYTDLDTEEVVAQFEIMRGKSPTWKVVATVESRRPSEAGEPVYERKP